MDEQEDHEKNWTEERNVQIVKKETGHLGDI